MRGQYLLSVLLPSAPQNIEKRARFLRNLQETVSDLEPIEVVICLDADDNHYPGQINRIENFVYVYAEPSVYRSTFFNAAWRASTGRWLLMANDDMLFKTKGWDKLIPYENYPDDLVMFHFRDNQFNERFACHPVWSRQAMNYDPNLFEPLFHITKCDNTIWDMHPPHRRVYLPEIEIDHLQMPYGYEWGDAYDADNAVYFGGEASRQRKRVLDMISKDTGFADARVMVGVTTAEYARRADFYDHFNLIVRPPNTICVSIHGQSIAYNRNQIVEQALIHKCTHVFFLDDDVICNPNIIYKLLEHEKDIVTALQLKRDFPHFPLIFGPRINETQANHFQLPELGHGLLRVYASGLGAVLMNIDVFKRMDKPWFRLGELQLDQMSEDTGFFRRAEEDGIQSYCDLDCQVGHIGSVVIKPMFKDGSWIVDYNTNGSGTCGFVPPMVKNESSMVVK